MLIKHLQNKTEVQNIDLMNLADFVEIVYPNGMFLSKDKGIEISYDDAREIVYGMPYSKWERLVSERGHKRTIRKI